MFYDMFVYVYLFVYVTGSFLTNTYHDTVTDPIGYKKESLLLLYVGIQWNVMMITVFLFCLRLLEAVKPYSPNGEARLIDHARQYQNHMNLPTVDSAMNITGV